MPPAEHPIWPILKLLVTWVGLASILYVNASEFDATELKALIAFVVFGGAVEGSAKAFTNYRRQRPEEDEEEEEDETEDQDEDSGE